MKKIMLCIIITGSLAASAAANARIPYAQALAICKGHAAQVMAGSATTPLIYSGLIRFLMLQAHDGQRQTDVMNDAWRNTDGWFSRQARELNPGYVPKAREAVLARDRNGHTSIKRGPTRP